jgi:hypothetical protein
VGTKAAITYLTVCMGYTYFLCIWSGDISPDLTHTINVHIFYSICDTCAFVELSYDKFTFFTDDILFSMLQDYLNIFLFCDRISTRVSHVHGY